MQNLANTRPPELLAPAGDWDCARAAVENGADAIYFGLEKFNARMRAHNFTEADLPQLVRFLHERGVKGYVTFNTLVFENELPQAEEYARAMIAAGVDAAIVQDVGICRLIRHLSPDFPIHVSTQMTVTSAGGLQFARELGCDLVVLARECSLRELELIQAAQAEATETAPLPLEVFVHGALCVAYSGQCLTSEALGGRSANRGECAQACRMPYDLLADGRPVPLGDRKYLLSPQDLAGLPVLPELVRLGVASLKIEGRLKSPEYVASITRIYRQALDDLEIPLSPLRVKCAEEPKAAEPIACPGGRGAGVRGHFGQGFTESTIAPVDGSAANSPAAQYEMEMTFSRGLFTGWFGGVNNQKLVHAQFGKKRGVYLGQVAEVRSNGVVVELAGPLKPGDGVVFDAGRPEETEQGGRIYQLTPLLGRKGTGKREFRPAEHRESPGFRKSDGWSYEPRDEQRSSVSPLPGDRGRGEGEFSSRAHTTSPVLLCFGRGDIDFRRVHIGDRIWKTSDPELERRLRQSFQGDKPRRQRPLRLEVHGLTGRPLVLLARDELGHVVKLESAIPLSPAERQPLTTERLSEQLGRLGGTPFKLGELKNLLIGSLMLPLSELNRLRREMVEQLLLLRSQPARWTLNRRASRGRTELTASEAPSPAPARARPQLIVLVRSLAQLEAVLRQGIETVYCEFEDLKKYREAVARFRAAASADAHSAIFVAPPRIFKMGEEWTLNQVRSCEADGYLVRNYDHLKFFASDRCVGDYSLNVANRLTAEYFKTKFSLERVTASYDLNFAQLEALLQAAPPDWFEVTVHQHMPMFHMEHCVFCAFLSEGTDYTNCGRPCDRHDLRLRDRVGAEHPVKADAGCRNTVFNGLAQTGAEYIHRMLALGVGYLRLEFLNETPDQVLQTVQKYRQLLRGELTGTQLWRELKLFNQLGVTRGQLSG